MQKIGFAGSPEISAEVMEHLICNGFNICLCLTQPDKPFGRGRNVKPTPVKELAEHNNIPVISPTTLKTPEIQREIKSYNLDVIIVFAYGLIVPESILSIPKYGCINIHASILPRWRGASPIQHSILYGDKTTGITIMQMDKGLDTGNIILKKEINIEENETTPSLTEKLTSLSKTAIVEAIQTPYDRHKFECQDDSQSTYAHKIKKQDAQIHLTEDVYSVDRKIRAFCLWPKSYIEYKDKVIKIISAKISFLNIVSQDIIIINNKLYINFSNGALEVTKLQLEGKKIMSTQDALNGSLLNFIN